MKRNILTIISIIISVAVFSQTQDTLLLKEVQINSTRISIQEEQMLRPVQIIDKSVIHKSYDNDISSAMKEFSGVDIRQRSFGKSQSDINIRGGSFDQSLVLLNGINLTDPQTGHHNLNIPISNSDLYGVEVVYGPGSRTFGANAFSGAINFISDIPNKNNIAVDLLYGSFNTFSVNVAGGLVIKKLKQSLSVDYSRSDGFMHNTDYEKLNLYYENNFSLGSVKAKTMLGYLDKGFGSYGFYSPDYIDQYEHIKTGFAAFKLLGGENFKWEFKAYYRVHKDHYELFRKDYYVKAEENTFVNKHSGDTLPLWYSGANNHLSSVAGSGVNVQKDWKFGKSALGIEYRYEHIYSNTLGLLMNEPHKNLYTHSGKRDNLSFFAEHGYYKNKLMINLGSLAFWNEEYSWNFYYGGDIGYKFTDNFIVKTGVNRAMRLPTFTDLYYVGPSNVGNPDLIPESAISFDLGAKYYFSNNSFFNINVFERLGRNIISWIRDKELSNSKWEPQNVTKLNTVGVELSAGYKDFPKEFFINNINLIYAYLYQDKSSSGLESKYTIDHLKHRLVLNLDHKIYKNISAFWSLNIFKRNGEFALYDYDQMQYVGSVEYKTNTLLNLRISAEFNKFIIYAGGYNLTNANYFDIGNIPTTGISFMFGIKCKFMGS
ncbi:TonB-dependent receptor [Bacteroidales bacterium OttesenSCG-928-I21]|nr:TonB-dependent receptor [Bacteroidales bacterium OttesenSCG-928-I21]